MQDSLQAACICKNMTDRSSVDGASMDDCLNRNRMELRCLHAKPWFTRSLLRQPYPDNPDLVVRLSKCLEFCFSLCPELLWLRGPVVFTAIPSFWSEVRNQTFISPPMSAEPGRSLGTWNEYTFRQPSITTCTRGTFSFKSRPFCSSSLRFLWHFIFSFFPGECTRLWALLHVESSLLKEMWKRVQDYVRKKQTENAIPMDCWSGSLPRMRETSSFILFQNPSADLEQTAGCYSEDSWWC